MVGWVWSRVLMFARGHTPAPATHASPPAPPLTRQLGQQLQDVGQHGGQRGAPKVVDQAQQVWQEAAHVLAHQHHQVGERAHLGGGRGWRQSGGGV